MPPTDTTPIGSSYPAYREVDVALRSGASIRLRPIRSEDEAAVHALLEGLSTDSRVFRFFSAGTDLRASR